MDKSAMRASMRSRGVVETEVAARVMTGLRTWMSGRLPGTVAAYLAMADEVDVTGLFAALPGWRWVLPRVEPDATLTFRDRDVPWQIHRLGMRQPIDAGAVIPIAHIDMLLVPGLAFDRSGARLGRGGGYYDRALADRRRDSVTVGVTPVSRLVEKVPQESHDQRVGWLATEEGVTECPTRK